MSWSPWPNKSRWEASLQMLIEELLLWKSSMMPWRELIPTVLSSTSSTTTNASSTTSMLRIYAFYSRFFISFRKYDKVIVVGGGKGAIPMVQAADHFFNNKIIKGEVVTKYLICFWSHSVDTSIPRESPSTTSTSSRLLIPFLIRTVFDVHLQFTLCRCSWQPEDHWVREEWWSQHSRRQSDQRRRQCFVVLSFFSSYSWGCSKDYQIIARIGCWYHRNELHPQASLLHQGIYPSMLFISREATWRRLLILLLCCPSFSLMWWEMISLQLLLALPILINSPIRTAEISLRNTIFGTEFQRSICSHINDDIHSVQQRIQSGVEGKIPETPKMDDPCFKQ